MATHQHGPFRAARAAADLSAKRNHAVDLNNNGELVGAGAGAAAFGILNDAPKQGQTGTVQIANACPWVAGTAFAAGTWLTPNSAGRAITAAAGNFRLARAREASAGDGSVVTVEILHAGNVPTS